MKQSKYDVLISHIPYGMENAISQKQLCELMGCTDTELRSYIQNARIDGIAILSVPGVTGYYFSNEESEILPCYKVFKHRQKSTGYVLRTINRHLRSIERGERHVR